MVYMVKINNYLRKKNNATSGTAAGGLLLSMLILLAAALGSPAKAQDDVIKVAVAANLLIPMEKVKQLYEKKFRSKLILIPGSSGKLTAQILNGAPYDVFLSADMKYPRQIVREGHAQTPPSVLMRGKLVFWSKNKPGGDLKAWITSEDMRSIAIAQPELAPYGQRARDWLSEQGIYEQLLPRIIFGESIGQVNQYIHSATVEAAFTAVSAMHAEQMQEKGYWQVLDIQSGDASSLDHGIVLLTNAVASKLTVNQFLEFIKSPVAEKVFREFGYEFP
jgi:molybdate transport system substrate-binding protein